MRARAKTLITVCCWQLITNNAPVSQDTFSFALVLLCLAVGDIAFVRNRGRAIAWNAYASGFRYKLPKPMRKACPEIAALIKEMWVTDFRARPAMKDVTARLEACTFTLTSGAAGEAGIGDGALSGETTGELTTIGLTAAAVAKFEQRIRELEVKNEQLEVQIKEQSICGE